ncbi:hypothetical protein V493_03738 [Pseudogymnoascus sp. VKM F-4281 (FW-2241)]|nr:hypothetical protein V493_03738 [Pseudogymnoascus sp. VKM F-4281 (FW-2241)]
MPPALDGLPNEIISSILTQLHGDQATLAAICRVSRYLGSVATAPLYRVIQQHEDGPHDPCRTPLLLRTLLLNPALGSHIVEVQLKIPGQEHEDVSCFSEEEWLLLKAQVARLYGTGLFTDDLFSKNILHTTDPCDSPGSEWTWNKNVREGQWDAVLSLMLYCCPRLEKLRGFEWDRWNGLGPIYPGFYFFTFFMSGVARSKAQGHLHAQKSRPRPDRVPILPQYRYAHLSLKAESPGRPILLQSLLPFLYSSAIELDQVDTKIEGGGTERYRLWGDLMFPTKKLVIRGSLMSANTLGYLLDSFEVLEEFLLEYGIGDKKYLYVSMRRMVHGSGPLPRGLLRSKKTLTKLELARGFSALYAQDYSSIDQTLGSLRDFEVLTHLTVKLELLIWHAKPSNESSLCDIMPRSLEFLSIATEDVLVSADLTLIIDTVSRKERSLLRNVHHFEELVLRKESVVPNLWHLVLDGIQRETADSSALATLKRACATSSVQLSIVLYHVCFPASGESAMRSERVNF